MNRITEVREVIHQRWLQRSSKQSSERVQEDLRYQLGGITEEVLREQSVVLTERERRALIQEVQNEVQGFGPLEPFMLDPGISDILVNGPDQIFIERAGVLYKTQAQFSGSVHLKTTLDRMLVSSGRRIDESLPMVDARLPSGARLHAILPPVALNGIVLSIRKFSEELLTLEQLVDEESVSPAQASLLTRLIESECNLIISGGTGSGKTTLLKCLAQKIPNDERVVTIEEAAELALNLPHVLRLEARPANIEAQGEVSLAMLLRNALRMRPDRIIIGEVRGHEVFDMLQAMNSGHRGSMATLHANSPRDALIRLENLMSKTGWVLSTDALRQQLVAAIQVIVQMKRYPDGRRRVSSLSEVVGMESGRILLQDLAGYREGMGFYHHGFAVRALENAQC